ncbi:MAG: flippase-like domain-containing protein, partial [Candidatus Aenigmarchaeota archaeon]|nr:flippase-like domain-containing protein [Candidatus Aenigmarchaeota archaeon]
MKHVFLAAFGGVAILFFFLLQRAGIQDVAYAFMRINVLCIPLIIGLPFAMLFVYATRWGMLLRSVGVKAEWGQVWRYSIIGAALNNITPMVRFGGEPLKCYLLSKELSCDRRPVLASLAMDSLITAVSLLVLIYIGAFGMAMLNIVDIPTLGVISALLLVPLLAGVYVVYDKRVLRAFSRGVSRSVSRFSGKEMKGAEDSVVA